MIFCRKVDDFARTLVIGNGKVQTGVDSASGHLKGHSAKVSRFKNQFSGPGVQMELLDQLPRINVNKVYPRRGIQELFGLEVVFGLGGYYLGDFICIEQGSIHIQYGRTSLRDYQIILTNY